MIICPKCRIPSHHADIKRRRQNGAVWYWCPECHNPSPPNCWGQVSMLQRAAFCVMWGLLIVLASFWLYLIVSVAREVWL